MRIFHSPVTDSHTGTDAAHPPLSGRLNSRCPISSRHWQHGISLLAALFVVFAGTSALGQDKKHPWDELGEKALWNKLRELRESQNTRRAIKLQKIVKYADALARRFPESQYRTEALIMKLGALAGLAGTDPYYIPELYYATDTISCETPTGRLASENSYYAIQAFVFAARREEMPRNEFLNGTRQLYEHFLEDHQDSRRRPIIMASLMRNYLRLGEPSKAEEMLNLMRNEFPRNPATGRAEGEYNRFQSVNKPVTVDFEPETGDVIRSADHRGKVVMIHLWTAFIDDGISSFNTVAELYRKHSPDKFHVVSLNLDRDRTRADVLIERKNIPWPQAFDKRGLRCPLLQEYGIYFVPAYFVIDAEGVLRYLDDGDGLDEIMTELLGDAESEASPGNTAPAKKAPANRYGNNASDKMERTTRE